MRTIFVLIIVLIGGVNALKGAFEGLLFYLWIAYFRPDSWMWSATLVQVLNLSFNSGLYLLVRSVPTLLRPRLELRTALLFLFFALTGASAYTCATDPTSWSRWIDFAKVQVIAYLLYALTCEDLKRFRLALLVMSVSLGVEAAKQGYLDLLFRPGGINENPLPQLGDNNGVAVGMLMLAMFFIALSKTTPRWWEKRLHQVFVLGVGYRAISTYSRGAFLAAVAIMLVYGVRSNQKFRAAFGALVLAGVVLAVLPQQFWDRMSTMNVSSEEQLEDSSKSRLHFWRVAVAMANDHPVMGVGFNAYNANFDAYDYSKGFYGKSRSVHSMWFGILAELGYTGLLIFLSLLLLSVAATQQVARLARKGAVPMDYYYYAIALQTALAACFVGGSFVPWHYTEMLYHTIMLSAALRTLAMAEAAKTGRAAIPVPDVAREAASWTPGSRPAAATAAHRGIAHA